MSSVTCNEIAEAYQKGASSELRVQGALRGGVVWNGYFWFSASVNLGQFKVKI